MQVAEQGSAQEEQQLGSSLMEDTVQERFSNQSFEEQDLSQTGPPAWRRHVPIESPNQPSGVLYGNNSICSVSGAQ